MRDKLGSFVDVQEWAVELLANDAEFIQFCNDTIGDSLSCYSSFPFNKVVELDMLPAVIVYSEVFSGNNASQEDTFREWKLPFVIQIVPEQDSAELNNVTTWTSVKDIKKIAYKACETLEKNACMISGGDKRFMQIDTLTVTDIDEADDLQAQVFVTFAQDNGM